MNQASQKIEQANTDKYAIHTSNLNLWYGTFQALFDVNLNIKDGIITSLIGPSGCGKSTFLRSVNRINERLGYVRIEGSIDVRGQNIYDKNVEILQVRKQILKEMIKDELIKRLNEYAGSEVITDVIIR